MGFSFHSSKIEASKALNAFKKRRLEDFNGDMSSIEIIDCEINKKSFIKILNTHAGHNDNG
jgi:hypothetical protein